MEKKSAIKYKKEINFGPATIIPGREPAIDQNQNKKLEEKPKQLVSDNKIDYAHLNTPLKYPFICECKAFFSTSSALAKHRDDNQCSHFRKRYGELCTSFKLVMKQIGKSGDEKQVRAQQTLSIMELLIKELVHSYLPDEEIDRESFHSCKNVKEVADLEEEVKEEQKIQILEIQYNECPICYESYEGTEVISLTSCGHMFHQECLDYFLEADINQAKCPLVCPNADCRRQICESDMKKCLSPDQMNKYHQYSLQQALDSQMDIQWCPTPNCNYAYVLDKGGDEENQGEYFCVKCKKHYCLNCRLKYHVNQTCAQFQATLNQNKIQESDFKKFVQNQKFKQCPFCNFWVEKNEGCDHMRCKCGNEFCYACGGVYQACWCVTTLVRTKRESRLGPIKLPAQILTSEDPFSIDFNSASQIFNLNQLDPNLMQHTHYFACKDPPIMNNNLNNNEFNEVKEIKSIKNLFGLIKNKSDAKEESKLPLEDRIRNIWSDYSSKPESINVKKAFKLIKKVSNGVKLDESLTWNMIFQQAGHDDKITRMQLIWIASTVIK